MATPEKKSPAERRNLTPKAVARKASGALQDPEVRKLILEHADDIADFAKAASAWVADHVGSVGDRFGQKGLEVRAAKLRQVVASLSRKSPERAASLHPLSRSLDDVDELLDVAAALPFAKRKRAHNRIDSVLDELEKGLFDSALGGARFENGT